MEENIGAREEVETPATRAIILASILTSCKFTNERNREISRGVLQKSRGLRASVSSSPLPFPLPFFSAPALTFEQ